MTELTAQSTERPAVSAEEKARRLRLVSVYTLQRYGLFVLFVAVIIGFSLLLPDSFATLLNFRNIAGNQSVLAIVTLAAIIPLICGHFDLSVGANLGVSSIATASLLSAYSVPLPLAALGGIVLGALIGLCNGLLIAKLGGKALMTTPGG